MTDDPLEALQALGFTESEARVYLTLLSGPPATGYRIGVRAGMPRSMVYEALGRLEGRGAVLRSGDGRGNLYRPVPSDDMLDGMERDHRDHLARLRRSLRRRTPAELEAGFWTGRGREAINALAQRLLGNARRELLLMMPDEALERLEPELTQACRRKVRIGLVTTGTRQAPCGLSVRHPARESELQRLEGMLLICADGREVLIAELAGEGSATLTANALTVHIARQFVWMELLTQGLLRSGADPLALLPRDERAFLESVSAPDGGGSRRSLRARQPRAQTRSRPR